MGMFIAQKKTSITLRKIILITATLTCTTIQPSFSQNTNRLPTEQDVDGLIKLCGMGRSQKYTGDASGSLGFLKKKLEAGGSISIDDVAGVLEYNSRSSNNIDIVQKSYNECVSNVLSRYIPEGKTNQTPPSKHGVAVDAKKAIINGGTLSIVFSIKNISNLQAYFILFGPGRVVTDNGAIGMINSSKIIGVSHCYFSRSGDDIDALKRCRTASDTINSNGGGTNIENYTSLSSNEEVEFTAVYEFTDQALLDMAATVNAGIKTLVRMAPDGGNPSSVAPHVVEINSRPVQIKK